MSTDPAVPTRCGNCPHFENEHDDDGTCRALQPHDYAYPGDPEPCPCTGFVPRQSARAAEFDRQAIAGMQARQRREAADPQLIEATVLGIGQKARAAGITAVGGPDVVERLRLQQVQRDAESARTRWLDRLDGVPSRFRRLPQGWRPHPQVGEWLAHVEAGGTDSLVLIGGVGTGKTTQAFAAWAHLVRAGGVGRPEWVTVPALLESLRPGREPQVPLDVLQTAGLLLVDDLAAERDSEWTAEVLYRLLDHRYAWELPTIVTSNVPPPQITEKLGERIASRLAGMGRTVVLDGPDYRRPAR